jgi:hypothetical protein
MRGDRPSGAPSDLSAAFDAVVATLVLGTVAVEPERDENGSVHIWLDPDPGEAQGAARPRRELQRRDPAAGKGRRRRLNETLEFSP